MDVLERAEVESGVVTVKIDSLAGDRAIESHRGDGPRDQARERPAARGEIVMARGEKPVGMIEQGHGGENGQVLAEPPMKSLFAATHFRVVHRRKIVEDERAGVNHLERGGRGNQPIGRRSTRLAHGQQKDSANPLPAGSRGHAKRLAKHRRGRGIVRDLREEAADRLTAFSEVC